MFRVKKSKAIDDLTELSIRARACGMTYGQYVGYIASHSGREPVPRENIGEPKDTSYWAFEPKNDV